MKIVLDVENTSKELNLGGKKKIDMLPFRGNNSLVSVGIKDIDTKAVYYLFFNHKELNYTAENLQFNKGVTQGCLDKSILILGHNLKHDLAWITDTGFELPKDVKFWDTSIAEYVLAKGQQFKRSLGDLAIQHELPHKKSELIQEYLDKGIGFEAIPIAIVEEYGRGDLDTTEALYYNQLDRLQKPENWSLLPTIEMMNEFMFVLSKWQSNGIKIDLQELERVGKSYREEREILISKLSDIAREYLGDTPFNLSSGEDRSVLLYSRRVKDKQAWSKAFNIGLTEKGKKKHRPRFTKEEFSRKIRELTNVEYRTKCEQCKACLGIGKVAKQLKTGEMGKPRFICKECGGDGVRFIPTSRIAGFKCTPLGIKDCSVNGFVTDADKLEYLATQAVDEKAKEFLNGLIRLNQLNTWIDTFVEGIKRNTDGKSCILYTNFNQIITATGRLSSSDPNFQNIPRGKTFPIKSSIISRFEGGSIIEADFSGLEFRVAGALSQDKQIYHDIVNKVDPHAFTRDQLNKADNGNRDRQDAKPDTFGPLYGKVYGTPVQMAYFSAFKKKFPDHAKWQQQTCEFVLRNGFYKLPSGRQYRWLGMTRQWNGQVSYYTQIVCYPVQGFATGDIVPIACILVQKEIEAHKLKSVVFLTVHDSIAVDCFPGEEQAVIELLGRCMLAVREELKRRYNYDLLVPLQAEIKQGKNWLDMKVVSIVEHKVIIDKPKEFYNDGLSDIGA